MENRPLRRAAQLARDRIHQWERTQRDRPIPDTQDEFGHLESESDDSDYEPSEPSDDQDEDEEISDSDSDTSDPSEPDSDTQDS